MATEQEISAGIRHLRQQGAAFVLLHCNSTYPTPFKDVNLRYLRRLAEQRGTVDARLDDYRWLLEELRVSLFAQELRTPQPVSAKRLDKAWAQLTD